MSLHLEPIDHAGPRWPGELAALWAALGAPHNPELPPDYFVQTTFVKMGGRALRICEDGRLVGVGLLFPRAIVGGERVYTLRVSMRRQEAGGGRQGPADLLADLAPADRLRLPASCLLLPASPTYPASHGQVGGLDIGAPGAGEIAAIRALHVAIWGDLPGAQYPGDLFSAEFGPATALVARAEGRLAGFLLGFHRFGGLEGLERAGIDTSLCVESQVMGVDPALRRAGLAATLKRAQAAEALARGVGVIHWTADPLQFANATLNFHKLRAVAGEFTPAYYPFQNALNRVPASRLGIAWMPSSPWGRAGLADGPRRDRSLARFPGCAVLNAGPQILRRPAGAPHIAVEIPADWTALQAGDLPAAEVWRAATDQILAESLGFAPGRYLIADVASEGERRYLVGHAFEMIRQETVRVEC